jgi:cell division transport system ATP-binding protein
VIEAHHLSKAYRPGVFALRDLSFAVEKGEFVFLTGPSGAGKSTLFKLLLRAEAPTSGDVVVNGRNLARLTNPQIQAYRRTIGFVFQDFKLIPRKTVFDNVALVPRLMGISIRCCRSK